MQVFAYAGTLPESSLHTSTPRPRWLHKAVHLGIPLPTVQSFLDNLLRPMASLYRGEGKSR